MDSQPGDESPGYYRVSLRDEENTPGTSCLATIVLSLRDKPFAHRSAWQLLDGVSKSPYAFGHRVSSPQYDGIVTFDWPAER
jgi:hypothetical protein